jgi:tetratricopeptide (TPR) repeat protein
LAAASAISNSQQELPAFARGRAHLLLQDYASAEREFQRNFFLGRFQSNFNSILAHVPLTSLLAHLYLAQVYEATNKREQAVNEYQSFLSHFESTRLPQVAEARAALKRLM